MARADVKPGNDDMRKNPAGDTVESESASGPGKAGRTPVTEDLAALALENPGAVNMWLIWLILAGVLGIAELLTLTLAFALIAVAAVAAAAVAAADGGLPLQLLAFVLTAGAGLGLVRPFAMRHIKQPPELRTGTAALVGRKAIVVEEVTGHTGRVRIDGELWSSRAYDDTLVIPVGSMVDVLQIQGATALVYPRE